MTRRMTATELKAMLMSVLDEVPDGEEVEIPGPDDELFSTGSTWERS